MAVQTNSLLLQPTVAPFAPRRIDPGVDDIAIEANFELLNGSSMIVDGNLTVRGTTFTAESEIVKIADNHMYLNDGYTTAVAQTGGLVVNYLPVALTDTVAGAAFVAGIPATSNPTVATTGAATYSVGDLIQISGAADETNNGLFEVLSHSGNVLTIRGIGLTAAVEDFTQNQFIGDATVQGSITQVTVSVLRSGTDGIWEVAAGSTTGFTFENLVTAATAASTLQDAYENGNTITTSGAEGDVIINGDQSFQIGGTVVLDVNTTADFDVSDFDVLVVGGGFSLDADGASNVSTTAAALTLSTITSGTLGIQSAGLVDIDGVTVEIDATGAFSIDGAISSNVTANGSAGGAIDLTLSAVNAGAGTGNVLLSADDEIDLTTVLIDVNVTTLDVDASGAIQLDAAAASNFTVAGANLTLATTSSGDVIANAAGNVDIDGTAVTIDASAAFSLDGAAASNVSVTGADLTLSTITSGGLLLTSAGASTYTVPNATAAALTLTDGSLSYLIVDSTDNELELPQFTNISGGGGIRLTANVAIAVGEAVQIISDGGGANTGRVALTDADTGLLTDSNMAGIAASAAGGAGTAIQIFSVPGSLVPMLFGAAPAASANGDAVYLSTTAGQVTLTAPTGNDEVTFRVGWLQGADGADTTPLVMYAPQFLSAGPQVS